MLVTGEAQCNARCPFVKGVALDVFISLFDVHKNGSARTACVYRRVKSSAKTW